MFNCINCGFNGTDSESLRTHSCNQKVEMTFNTRELQAIEKAIRFQMERNISLSDAAYAELDSLADEFRDTYK